MRNIFRVFRRAKKGKHGHFSSLKRVVRILGRERAHPWETSDEEVLSPSAPAAIRCDACLAAASEVGRAFENTHRKEKYILKAGAVPTISPQTFCIASSNHTQPYQTDTKNAAQSYVQNIFISINWTIETWTKINYKNFLSGFARSAASAC